MYSMIYLAEDIKGLDKNNATLIVGGDKWKVYQDKNNCFSIGDEIRYHYKKTGLYRFLFRHHFYSNIWRNDGTTLTIQGIKEETAFCEGPGLNPYYYNKLLCLVKAEAGMSTNFKLNMINRDTYTPTPLNIKGSPTNQNITFFEVQYIDEDESESLEPIIITEDTELTLNRRHIVKAPILKTINLTLKDNASMNDWVEVKNMDLGNFQINPADNTQIMLNSYITKEKTGYIRSKKRGDFVRLECMDVSSKTIFTNTNTVGTFAILQ